VIMSAEPRWYAVQTYSGHENKVKRLIELRITEETGEQPEEKEIQQVMVPTQDVVEIKNGKRVTVTRRLYPGYVLVKMLQNQRTMHVINNIQGVIKFVGAGTAPQPLRDDEVNKILGLVPIEEQSEPREEIPFRAGQVVEVTEGPFSDFTGTVQEIYHDKGKVKVEVSLFGRPTSVELDYTQLKGY
jgi:transcription termination/antitermination protein NusG